MNLYLVSMAPFRFRATGRVSTISGMLNAATYIGSAASTYGVAVVTERAGWNATLLIWLAAAAAGTALCAALVRGWQRFTERADEG